MATPAKPPAKRPCGSCPYRKDVPPGLWHPEEYDKLLAYDKETGEQPPGLFMCHQQDGCMCAGWVGHGDAYQLLALRFWAIGKDDDLVEQVIEYETDVPLFETGTEAALHGMSGVEDPPPEAQRMIERLKRKQTLRSGTAKEASSEVD